MKVLLKVSAALLFSSALLACISSYNTAPPQEEVEGVQYEYGSGEWNAANSQKLAKKMVEDVLGNTRLQEWTRTNDRRPEVIIGTVRNKTSEHINTQMFVKDLESTLINSGEVNFVANAAERGEVRAERLDQQSNASEETMKRLANETAADFMLQGEISSSVTESPGSKNIYYVITLELVDQEKNTKIWSGLERLEKRLDKGQRERQLSKERVHRDW